MIVPSMTRAHFEFIAHTIRNLKGFDGSRGQVAYQFADILRATNKNFDRERFLAAALGESDSPLERLRHHVTGAIERGEKVAIVEKR
jgi:hypothetical protein